MFVRVTHQVNSNVADVLTDKIFAVYFAEAMDSTVLVSGEGGIFPVKESVEYVKEAITKEKEKLLCTHKINNKGTTHKTP